MAEEEASSIDDNPQSQFVETGERAKERTSISLWFKVKDIVTNITVEPIVFISTTSEMIILMCARNLMLEKCCRVNLALGEEICDALTARNESYPNYTVHVEAVHKYSTKVTIWGSIIHSFVPVIVLLLAGPWSDKHKRRKPCILMPIGGQVAMSLIYLICVFFFYKLPVEVSIVAELAAAITGNWNVLRMGVTTYISGITTTKDRTVRLGILNMVSSVSVCAGNALSGILYNKLGYFGVFSLCLVLFSSTLAYGLIFIKDIRDIEIEKGIYETHAEKTNSILGVFNLYNLTRTFRTCFKKGHNRRRLKVCLFVALAMIIFGPMYGEMSVGYFLQRYKYGWDPVDSSLFSTFQFIVTFVGTFLSLALFSKYLKWDDAILGLISSSSRIVGSIVLAVAPTPFWFYVGGFLDLFTGIVSTVLGAFVTKFIPPEDLGQVMSVLTAIQASSLLLYGPLYNGIYAATIDTFASAFYLVGAVLTVPAVAIFIYLYLENQKDRKREIGQKQQEQKLVNMERNETQQGEYSEKFKTSKQQHCKKLVSYIITLVWFVYNKLGIISGYILRNLSFNFLSKYTSIVLVVKGFRLRTI